MFERYSELSIRAIDIAYAAAREFGSEVVRDEHLLLGVVGAGAGTAAVALKAHNIGYKQIHEQLKLLTEPGTTSGVISAVPFDLSGKRTLEKAWLTSREHNHKKLYTGHILIGIIALGGGLVDVLLQNLLVNKIELRQTVVGLLDETAALSAEESTPKPSTVSNKVYDWMSAEVVVAMTLAEHEARRTGLSFLGTEHILIGLLLQESGSAAQVLTSSGVTIDILRQKIASITALSSGWTPSQLPLTRRAVKTLQAALVLAEEANQTHIETEHVLLAISRSEGGLAPQLLQELGVKILKVL